MGVLYFAYGSNVDAKQMRTRGAEFSERKRAILRDYTLKFNKKATGFRAKEGEGKGNVATSPQGSVEGALYTISQDGLKRLDEKEIGYYRVEVLAEIDEGTKVRAWTYFAEHDKTAEGLKPTREYLGHYLKGKDLFSEEYFRKLESTETLDSRRTASRHSVGL